MSSIPIVFAHGLEGSPEGAKVQALRAAGFDVIAPDGRKRVLADRIALLEQATQDGPLLLAGSSYGGLAAAWLAQQYPQRFKGLLLCAPALHLIEDPVADPAALRAPPGLRTIVIHGVHDQVVPLAVSQHYRDQSGGHVRLIERDDDHRLHGSLTTMVDAALSLMG